MYERVAEIKSNVGDCEKAHELEDVLYREVLFAIASGVKNARLLAFEATKTVNIEFPRHCA